MMDLLHAFPARDYYEHMNPPAAVKESLQTDSRPYLALLGGPDTWDIESHPALPLLGFFKTNDRDNAGMSSNTHWFLVFTAPGREEVAVLPWNESGKMPALRKPPVNPPPPGWQPKVTFSFKHEWRDVKHSRLPQGPVSWKVVLVAGSFPSNTLDVKVTGIEPHAVDPGTGTMDPTSSKSATDYPEADRKLFSGQPGDPEIPSSGVDFAEPVFTGSGDQPHLFLRAAFRFSEAPAAMGVHRPRPSENPPGHASQPVLPEFLRIHLVFSGPKIPGGKLRTIAVPTALIKFHQDAYEGHFGLDLAEVFRGPSGKVQVPEDLYLTVVRGGYISKTRKLDIPRP